MLVLPVTLATAAAVAAIGLWLALRISLRRFATGAMIGDGGDARLFALQRAHANLAEYAPLVLLLLAGLEAGGGERVALVVASVAFVLARVAHVVGMTRAAPNPWRAGGILVTWLVLAGLAGWAATMAWRSLTPAAIESAPAEPPRG